MFEQPTLPGIEPPPFHPKWPSPGSLKHEALSELLDGRTIDQPQFLDSFGSWRLAAVVNELRRDGWPVRAKTLPMSSRKGWKSVAAYSLPKSCIEQARGAP